MLDDQLFQRQPFLHNEQSALITEPVSSPTALSSYRTKNAVKKQLPWQPGRDPFTHTKCTVIPRQTKIIRSGITFVSRNLR